MPKPSSEARVCSSEGLPRARLLTVQRKQSGPTGDALVLVGAVAGFARRMTRRAVVILRLVGVHGTRRVTLVFVHYQVMLTTGALIRPVLAARAVRLAGHTCAVLSV